MATYYILTEDNFLIKDYEERPSEEWKECDVVNGKYQPYELQDRIDTVYRKIAIDEEVEKHIQFLVKTDHKTYPGYVPKDGEDLEAIFKLRAESREFIRANK